MNHQTQMSILDSLAHKGISRERESAVLNEAMLQLSSDWAFMISRDSAADYGRRRAQQHFVQVQELLTDASSTPLADSLLPFRLTWTGN